MLWENCAPQDTFLEAMADAASTVAKHFAGKIAYVAVMKNLSVDCDCCAVAEDPCMDDVGILSSLDPVALDRACVDLVMNSNDPGRDHFMERVNSRHGTHTIDTAAELGIRHKLIRPYTPRHNGKVERSHREDQKRFYSCHSFYSLEDFEKQLATHNRRANNLPMRPLHWLSPIEFAVQYV